MNNVLPFTPSPSLPTEEYTVSELSYKIKQSIENSCGYVRVRGEISGLKIASSGHAYFNLKDDSAVLSATCWRPTLTKMQSALDEGMEVIASGKITTYAGQSRYQINVDHIELAGAGALMQLLIKRKAMLQSEGLFDQSRKKTLPLYPKIIGVVTSISGAVIKDIIHRISDRCPLTIIVWPVTVQGDKAANEIETAINGFQKIESRPDVIIVARGGGSIEDLWAFNEEIVVRAVARSEIPIISAIGHETDFTLTDFAADVRAPTPTAAAEFATPVLYDLIYTINNYSQRIAKLLKTKIDHGQSIIRAYERVLINPMAFILRYEQKLDDITINMLESLPKLLKLRQMQLALHKLDLINPSRSMPLKINQLGNLANSLLKAANNVLQKLEVKLTISSELLRSLDYKNVIARGFAVIRLENYEVASSAKLLDFNNKINIEMKDGKLKAIVQEINIQENK